MLFEAWDVSLCMNGACRAAIDVRSMTRNILALRSTGLEFIIRIDLDALLSLMLEDQP